MVEGYYSHYKYYRVARLDFPATFDYETQRIRRRTNRMDVLEALLSPDMHTQTDASILSMAQVVVQILTAYKSLVGTSPINHCTSGYAY